MYPKDIDNVGDSMTITFEKAAIPVGVNTGSNPYVEPLRGVIDGKDAIQFTWTVTTNGVRKDFDKIKRELQAAGEPLDRTVRSYIYDKETGAKFKLPAAKGSKLVLVDSKKDPNKVTEFLVVAWVTDKIERGVPEDERESEDESEDDE